MSEVVSNPLLRSQRCTLYVAGIEALIDEITRLQMNVILLYSPTIELDSSIWLESLGRGTVEAVDMAIVGI